MATKYLFRKYTISHLPVVEYVYYFSIKIMFTEYLPAYFFILNSFLWFILFGIIIPESMNYFWFLRYTAVFLSMKLQIGKHLTSTSIWNIIFQVFPPVNRMLILFILLSSRIVRLPISVLHINKSSNLQPDCLNHL